MPDEWVRLSHVPALTGVRYHTMVGWITHGLLSPVRRIGGARHVQVGDVLRVKAALAARTRVKSGADALGGAAGI